MAKEYLKCRMEQYVWQPSFRGRLNDFSSYPSNLMAPDEMKNLGFEDDDKSKTQAGSSITNLLASNGKKP